VRPKDLSEFSYGYALTEALIQSVPDPLTAKPYFPTRPSHVGDTQASTDEGVEQSFSGELLYLQFKLADRMERRSAVEIQEGLFDKPFFRMPLRASVRSDLHAMLMELEASGYPVFYATPKFNTAKELDDAYLARGVVRESSFFRPLELGPLPDQKAHWVSFKAGSPVAYFCSEQPQPLAPSTLREGDAFLAHLAALPPRLFDAAAYENTAACMRDIILKEMLYGPHRRKHPIERFSQRTYASLREELGQQRLVGAQLELFDEAGRVEERFRRLQQERTPPEQVAYLARTFFGCEVLQLRKQERTPRKRSRERPGAKPMIQK